jgi:HEAT repeat protein
MFVIAQGSPLTKLRRAIAGGDLLVARTAASDLSHVDLDEAARLLVLIASAEPAKLDAAAVRFLGRVCLERSFITLAGARWLVAFMEQLERSDPDSRASFAMALRRLRLERAAASVETSHAPAPER